MKNAIILFAFAGLAGACGGDGGQPVTDPLRVPESGSRFVSGPNGERALIGTQPGTRTDFSEHPVDETGSEGPGPGPGPNPGPGPDPGPGPGPGECTCANLCGGESSCLSQCNSLPAACVPCLCLEDEAEFEACFTQNCF